MKLNRRIWLAGLLTTAFVTGCGTAPQAPNTSASAVTPQIRMALAPTGKLRVGVYNGSPTSLVVDKNGNKAGIAYELGRDLAQQLGVPFEAKEYKRIAEVIEAMKKEEVDFTFTNATEARAKDVSFSTPLVSLELGYLLPAGSPIQKIAEIDRSNVKVGVTEGSSSFGALSKLFKNATLTTAPTMSAAAEQLKSRQIDAFATNKGILYELANSVAGARILDERWGLEHMAIAIPKGRDNGLAYANTFGLKVKNNGSLQAIVLRSGLRGTVTSSQ